jgi:hypothetical protein
MKNSTARKLDSRFLAISLVFVPAIMIACWAGAAKADTTPSGIVRAPELHITADRCKGGVYKLTERLVTNPTTGAQKIMRHYTCEKKVAR